MIQYIKNIVPLFLCLLCPSIFIKAQRLNEDGLKMISCIRIAQKDTIYFKYDEKNRLKEIVCPFSDFEEHSEQARENGRLIIRTTQTPIPAKMVFTKVKDSIIQRRYKNGVIETSSPFHHIWKLNTYGKVKQYIIRYQSGKGYNDTYFDFKYDNSFRLKEFKTYTCFFRDDHSLSSFTGFGYYLIRYNRQGYFIDSYHFQLNELELKLPNLIDYINSHTWIGNEPAVSEYLNEKGYNYSADNKNDTNMNLNSLFAMYAKNVPKGSDVFNHVVLHTEWSGLREDFLATHCDHYGTKNYDVVYKRDLKGNIKEVLYCKDGYYKPKDDIIFIDYVDK